MVVTEGTSFELSDGSWQRPELSLDDSDLRMSLVKLGLTDKQIAKLSLELRYSWLSVQARKLLFSREAKLRENDQAWRSGDGAVRGKQLVEEIGALTAKLKAIE